jgi:hypothetical protein
MLPSEAKAWFASNRTLVADYEDEIDAVALQFIVGIMSMMILDGGTTALLCGIALVAFWGGATVLIWRHPHTPTKTDIELIRFGYLPLAVLAFFLVHFTWSLKGVQ